MEGGLRPVVSFRGRSVSGGGAPQRSGDGDPPTTEAEPELLRREPGQACGGEALGGHGSWSDGVKVHHGAEASIGVMPWSFTWSTLGMSP